ncbi:MAG TPA: CU044_2847 family protein [Mycobacteriales bacterium]|nr:CU044_2847 family protein [Mycobacteriales bacterium]
MAELTRFELEGGGSVVVEIADEPGVTRASRQGRIVKDARASFEKALGEVRDAASAALGQFRSMARQPDEVEITFGVKLDAEAGAVIAKTGVEGHFAVTLSWRREPSGSTAAPASTGSDDPGR